MKNSVDLTATTARGYRLLREASITGITQFSCIIGGVASIKIITSYIDPVEYGTLSLILTIISMMNLLVFGSISNGLGRFYPVAIERNDFINYYAAGKCLLLIAILATLIIAMMSAGVFWYFDNFRWALLAIPMSLYCIASTLNSIIAGLLNTARQRTLAGILMGFDIWLRMGFAVIMLTWAKKNSESVIYGYIISSILILIISTTSWRIIFKYNSGISEKSIRLWRQKIWKYGRPFVFLGIFAWVQQQSARWALEFFCTTSQVGYFSVLLQIGSAPIQALSGSLMMFLSPILFSKAGDAKEDSRRNHVILITHKIAAIGFLATLVLFLFSIGFNREILLIVTSPSYLSVSHLLPIVVLSSGLNSIATLYHVRFCSLMAIQAMLPITAISSIISCISSISLTNIYSLFGASISLMVYPIVYLILVRIYGVRIEQARFS